MSDHSAQFQAAAPKAAPLPTFFLNLSGIGTWQLYPQTQIVHWDARCKELYGFAPEDEVTYDQVLKYMHPDDRAGVDQAVTAAVRGENEGKYEIQFRTIGATDGKTRWLFCKGQAFFDSSNQPTLFAGTAQDISVLIHTQENAERVERFAQNAITSAQVGSYSIDIITGEFLYTPQLTFLFTGSREGTLTRQDFIDRIHPEDLPNRETAYKEALQLGTLNFEMRVLHPNDEIRWLKTTGAYEFNEAGQPIMLSGIVEDITERKLATLEVEKSARFANTIIQDSPVAKIIVTGKDFLITTINREMKTLLQKGDEVVDQPLLEAIPAFQTTTLPDLIRQVMATGQSLEVREESFKNRTDLFPAGGCYRHKHNPLRDADGKVYGVICSWIDMTQEVELRTKESTGRMLLNTAIEAAQLGTFEVNPALDFIQVSPRIREWMGFEPGDALTMKDTLVTLVDPTPLIEGVRKAMAPDGDGILDVEYQMVNRKTGVTRYLHSRGQKFLPENQAPFIVGTTQDITLQRDVQMTLQAEVQERVEELATAMEELQTTNEELEQANRGLSHSNEELAQYAYVASHDLQEPLRKIQVFSGMLNNRKDMPDDVQELTGKISQSATRMTLLIRDLLNFSRILNSESIFESVDLNKTVANIVGDFDLAAKEKGAQFETGELPVMEAVPLQMNQLFYNLVGNALKFTRPDTPPVVTISSQSISAEQISAVVDPYIWKPTPSVSYYQVCVQDNGIGFEKEYASKIFEVFKRLHGRNVYPGTGIGLALCRRIIDNHRGYLYTDSKPGEGASFYLILPAKHP